MPGDHHRYRNANSLAAGDLGVYLEVTVDRMPRTRAAEIDALIPMGIAP